jgi:hypothetical protein
MRLPAKVLLPLSNLGDGALGAVLLLASAVWSGTVIETKLVQLETISGPSAGTVHLDSMDEPATCVIRGLYRRKAEPIHKTEVPAHDTV